MNKINDKKNIHNTWPWDHIYVINLERSKQRWSKIKKSLEKEGISSKSARYNAIDGKRELKLTQLVEKGILDSMVISLKMRAGKIGAVAQYLTMAAVFKHALNKNYKQILFLEDDVLLVPHFKKKLLRSYSQLPSKWDIFYLLTSENPEKNITKFKSHLGKPFKCNHTMDKYGNLGFIIKPKAMKEWLRHAFPIREASDMLMINLITGSKVDLPWYQKVPFKRSIKAFVALPALLKMTNASSNIRKWYYY